MNFFFVRHTSVDVLPGICYGQTDVPLKRTFIEEAKAVKARLADMKLSEGGFDSVYCSPLQRCRMLADYCGYDSGVSQLYKSSVMEEKCSELQRGDKCIVESRIMEIDFGEWEMHAFDEIKDPRLQEWYDDYLHVSATGGESFQQQYVRVSSFIEEVRNLPVLRHKNVLVFTHGGVIICAQLYAGLINPEQAFSALSPYGSIIKIAF
jgi:alpha-ribazole phosphatase